MRFLSFLLLLPFSLDTPASAAPPLEFSSGNRVLLYGNSFIERLQELGVLEAAIQLAHPDKKLEFRSLAWTGDEVGYRLRPERYVNHLGNLLREWPADIVLSGGFGWTEAFAGLEGLPTFENQYRTYLRELKRRHPDATLAIILPPDTPLPTTGRTMTGAAQFLPAYLSSMTRIAETEDAIVVPSHTGKEIHPGNTPLHNLSLNIATQLVGEKALQTIDHNRINEVAQAVAQKASHVATLVRPVNAVIYFGVRGRKNEYDAEMPRYHELVRKADALIHELAANPGRTFSDYPRPALPRMKGVEKKNGLILSPAEMARTIKVADGYKLNLFASEEQFPELRNPVQIAFGPRGRLWVVTMPSFPHTVPGEPPFDKILILEDTDRDGVADRRTVFAEGLNVPDGIVFYRDGVIISAQPRHLYMWDSDGDGVADRQEEILRGIDVTDSHHGGMIAMDPLGHLIFCDGVFHRSQFETPSGVVRGVDATTYRLDIETGHLTSEYQTLTPNPWKVTFDRWGNLFQMYGDGFVQDSQLVPWTPLGIYHPFKRAISIAYGKGSGAEVISSPNFPDDYQQGMASATLVRAHFVSLSKLNPGSGFNKASDRVDLLVSKNNGFRPADMCFGFDGALYVSDFSCTIIGHAQHPIRDPRWDSKHGRIWRVIHTDKPVVKEWPRIASAGTQELLSLLNYPQDNIRALARVRLRNTRHLARALDTHLRAEHARPLSEHHLLELLWLFESQKEARPVLLRQLLRSGNFRIRAAATRLIRFQEDRLPDALELLASLTTDPHPRVRAEVINAVSHLQQKDPRWTSLLGRIDSSGYPVLATMLKDLRYGTRPAKGPEVPVLKVPGESQLTQWIKDKQVIRVEPGGLRNIKEALIKTYLHAAEARSAILHLRHQHARVSVNGVQLLDAGTWWSSDWNLQVSLRKGVNEIEIAFTGGSRAQGIAPVYLFSPLGTLLEGVRHPGSQSDLQKAARDYGATYGIDSDTIRLTAVPNQLAFAPRELRIQRGRKVLFLFDNPDHQIHNVVICKPDSSGLVGALADKMALDPGAREHQYVPRDQAVLWSTPLVDAGQQFKLSFTAPALPGRYPILCTYPGHWRLMKATLIVE